MVCFIHQLVFPPQPVCVCVHEKKNTLQNIWLPSTPGVPLGHYSLSLSLSLSLFLSVNITCKHDGEIPFPVLLFRLRAPPETGEVGGFVWTAFPYQPPGSVRAECCYPTVSLNTALHWEAQATLGPSIKRDFYFHKLGVWWQWRTEWSFQFGMCCCRTGNESLVTTLPMATCWKNALAHSHSLRRVGSFKRSICLSFLLAYSPLMVPSDDLMFPYLRLLKLYVCPSLKMQQLVWFGTRAPPSQA